AHGESPETARQLAVAIRTDGADQTKGIHSAVHRDGFIGEPAVTPFLAMANDKLKVLVITELNVITMEQRALSPGNMRCVPCDHGPGWKSIPVEPLTVGVSAAEQQVTAQVIGDDFRRFGSFKETEPAYRGLDAIVRHRRTHASRRISQGQEGAG